MKGVGLGTEDPPSVFAFYVFSAWSPSSFLLSTILSRGVLWASISVEDIDVISTSFRLAFQEKV